METQCGIIDVLAIRNFRIVTFDNKQKNVGNDANHLKRFGIISEKIRVAIPIARKRTAFSPAPFHSFRITPHTLLNTTFSDMSMLHENAIITLSGSKKLCPIPRPKNWEYHNKPAKAQNNVLLIKTDRDERVISPPVLFFRFM